MKTIMNPKGAGRKWDTPFRKLVNLGYGEHKSLSIVIPKQLVESIGWTAGEKVCVIKKGDSIVIKKVLGNV